MGVDYRRAFKVDADKPCVDDDGETNGNCKASCEFVEGRYDCWSFPCLNGAYCLDGADAYTCYCKDGYTGTNCQKDIDECTILEPAVCDPNADCINYPGGYSCSCRDGWNGDGFTNNTDVPIPAYAKSSLNTRVAPGCSDIDDCALRPCWHGGACTDRGTLSYECDCLHGWIGQVCDTDIDECMNGQGNCDSHAKCSNTPGSFDCICDEGWTGDGREGPKPDEEALFGGCVDQDDCHKCANGGTCYDLGGGTGLFTCECVFGWEGDACERDFDECHPSSEDKAMSDAHDGQELMECDRHAECVNSPGSYSCECAAGFTGDGLDCQDADDCEFSPCNNGGTCMDCGILCFVCDCAAGWRGRACQEDWDECKLGIHKCHNDAQCSNSPGSYDCICDEGYSGDGFNFCIDVDDCVQYLPGEDLAIYTDDIVRVDAVGEYVTPCGSYDEAQDLFYKHGECKNLDSANIFACTCAAGWTDYNCDRDINECNIAAQNSCHRFASCRNTDGSYECACEMGYTGNGRTCHDIDDCIDAPCQHGVCSDVGTDHYMCRCYPGYTDVNCDYDVNECGEKTHECHPDAACGNTVGSYSCRCNDGYEGDGIADCHDEDDCAASPCQSGTCVDKGDSAYGCICLDGWMDTKCDQDVNECFLGTHDCHPELAKCLNSPGSFYCRCFAGYVGDGRECIDLDDCDPDPCTAGHGECLDLGQHAYVCECEDGYDGERCTMDVDECIVGSHACAPTAHCLNEFGGYVCDCFTEHFGDGLTCGLCAKCGEGWAETSKCGLTDRTCENVNECELQSDNCHVNAQCTDTPGSFLCECRNDALAEGSSKLWTGDGKQCSMCTECGPGYKEVLPCTSSQDRTCEIAVKEGLYYISTTAGGSSQCLVMGLSDDDVFPYRYNWGYGDKRKLCGIGDWNGLSPEDNLLQAGIAVWKLKQIKGDYYTMENNARGKGYTCLAYPHGNLPYPQLFSWGRDGADNCGINKNGVSAMDAMLGLKSAVWRIVPLDGNSVLLQSNTRAHGWECIGFAGHGMATNPSRLDFGSMSADEDDRYCHIQRGPLESPVPKLLVDQRAVFELNWLGPLENGSSQSESATQSRLEAFEATQEAQLEKTMDDGAKHARERERER